MPNDTFDELIPECGWAIDGLVSRLCVGLPLPLGAYSVLHEKCCDLLPGTKRDIQCKDPQKDIQCKDPQRDIQGRDNKEAKKEESKRREPRNNE